MRHNPADAAKVSIQMKRRSFLIGATALTLGPRVARGAEPVTLTSMPSTVRIAPADYPETRIWSYDGLSPGPELRLSQGDVLRRRLRNDLEVPTTIHWHGIRLDNAMDGVPDLTQQPVAPGETFDYRFACPDAGTFWYHSHQKAVEQVERGLYGALIVEESEPPDVDADHVLVLDDWRLDEDAQITGDFDNGHDLSHAGRIGNVVTTNGDTDLALDVSEGDRLRLRLINAANARVFELGLHGLSGWIVATDGMPMSVPRRVSRTFELAPAQRIDLVVDVTAGAGNEATLVDVVGRERFAQTTFRVGSGGLARDRAPEPLPANPDSQVPAVADAKPIPVRMSGGAMAWLSDADSAGGRRSGRELAADGLFWALNGYAGRPETPLAVLERGQTVRLDFVNDTRWPHAMHLHGHHFFEIGPDGRAGDFRDTTLVRPGQTGSVVFSATNPGDWLLHCHMLGHHASGMGTWLRVN